MKTKIKLYEYGEWTSLPFKESEEKEDFLSFLAEVWQNRKIHLQHSSIENGQQLFFIKGNQIRAKNYVGVIQWQNIEIEVLPKFCKGSSIEKKLIWEHVFYFLSFSKRFNFPFIWSKSLTNGDTNFSFLELIIALFCQSLDEYLQKNTGLQYEVKEGESSYLKGKLDVTSYTKKNLSTGKWDKIRYQYQPLAYDNLFNQVLKFTIHYLKLLAKFSQNQSVLENLSHQFETVSTQAIQLSDIKKVHFNTNEKLKLQLLEMCEYFFFSQYIGSQVDSQANIAVLLPMEIIFEDFVSGFLQENCSSIPINIQQSHFLDKAKTIQIRPDILFGENQLPIDTKYKLGDSHSDIYQIISYIIIFGQNQGFLIYPQEAEQETSMEEIRVVSSHPEDEIIIKKINLKIIDESVEELKNHLKEDFGQILDDFLN